MSVTVKCTNLAAFRASLRAVEKATRKDAVVIVNSALKDVAYRAAQFTPKATAAKINASFTTPMLAAMAVKQLKATQGRFTRAELKKTMRAIVARSKRGIGALRAGWIPAILALGGTYRGAKLKAGGSASKGVAKPATISRLSGLITNAVVTKNHAGQSFSADQIAVAVDALNKAVAFVARDKMAYAKRKIEDTLRKHSDHK